MKNEKDDFRNVFNIACFLHNVKFRSQKQVNFLELSLKNNEVPDLECHAVRALLQA